MPKSLPLVLLLFPFCIACNRYQYSTISSSQLDKNEINELVFENDSLKLVYNFMGRDLGPEIFIENKLSVPVYIDWRESALVVDGRTHSYAPIQVDLYGNALSGLLTSMPSTMDFIPPRANVNKTPLVLTQYYSTDIPKSSLHKTRYTAAGISHGVKTAIFTESTSPMRFRSIISYMVGSSNSEPLHVEHSFYISSVMNARTAPPGIMVNGNHGNQFYTSKLTAGGTVAAVLAFGAITAGVIITDKFNGTSAPY